MLLASGAAGLVVGAQSGDPASITGVVTSGAGPEAGVWVISETGDLPTKFRKIVVTDDEGRFPAAGTPGSEGLDVDRNGVLWTALSGTNHLASFDRSRCGSLTGPEAHTGRYCAAGWTLHPLPGPTFKGTDVRADYNYYKVVVGWC